VQIVAGRIAPRNRQRCSGAPGTFRNATTFSSIDGGIAVRNNYAAVLSAAVLIAIGVPALVQADEQSHKGDKTQPGAPKNEMKDGPDSGSKNMSSTGWTGGEGTSWTGVTTEGRPESNQPETAKGLDPTKDKKSPH
jgi:hypothetical protein